jgi:chromosome segregation ATPase
MLSPGNPSAANLQSLADVARQEAERRKQLEEQGIEAKVITGIGGQASPSGSVTVSSPAGSAPERSASQSAPAKKQSSVRGYREALQKLDRAIRQDEERLQSLRTQLQAEKWAIPKVGRVSGRKQTEDKQSRLQAKIDEIQARMKRLRQERIETYDAGRRAGLLPGELEGKGIIP